MNDTRTPQVDDTNTETDDEKSGDDDSESPPTAPPIQNAAPPSPSPIRRRLGRILFWIALIWAAFKLYSSLISMEKKKPEITYASWCVSFFFLVLFGVSIHTLAPLSGTRTSSNLDQQRVLLLPKR